MSYSRFSAGYPSMDTLQWDLMRMRYAGGADLEELKLDEIPLECKQYTPKFVPTKEQEEAFNQLAKLQRKIAKANYKPREFRDKWTHVNLAETGEAFEIACDAFGDFNGNGSDNYGW